MSSIMDRIEDGSIRPVSHEFFEEKPGVREGLCGCCLIGAVAASVYGVDSPLCRDLSPLDLLLGDLYERRKIDATKLSPEDLTDEFFEDLLYDIFESISGGFNTFAGKFSHIAREQLFRDAKDYPPMKTLYDELPRFVKTMVALARIVYKREDFESYSSAPFQEIAGWFDAMHGNLRPEQAKALVLGILKELKEV